MTQNTLWRSLRPGSLAQGEFLCAQTREVCGAGDDRGANTAQAWLRSPCTAPDIPSKLCHAFPPFPVKQTHILVQKLFVLSLGALQSSKTGGFPPGSAVGNIRIFQGGTGLHTLSSCAKLGSAWSCLELGFGPEFLIGAARGGACVCTDSCGI